MYLFEVSLAFVERKHSLMQEAKEEVRGSGTVQAVGGGGKQQEKSTHHTEGISNKIIIGFLSRNI